MELNYLLLILFFGAVYICSSIVPALAPSEVKSTKKQILLLLKLTTSATIFLVVSDLSTYVIGGISAVATLLILFLLKDNQSAYYLLPSLIGLAIISENYYILTCMTTTLFLKGIADYAHVKKIKISDQRLSMLLYLIIATTLVIITAKLLVPLAI